MVYNYYYSGSKLVRLTYGDYVLDFFYDAMGTPIAMRQGYASSSNYVVYYYITNLQGDVIRLVDFEGNTAAYYEYDPYGNAIQASGSHATINPLRYRGYVYDTETGFYYLQSRYYDPQIGRFINADTFTSTGQGLLGNNMFAYCRNNPVMRVDISGFADTSFEEKNDDDTEVVPLNSGGAGGAPGGSGIGGTVSGSGSSVGSGTLGVSTSGYVPQGKPVTNPGGRHGGAEHRAVVNMMKAFLKALGFEVSDKESRVYYGEQGQYRYPDITAQKNGSTLYVQVGRYTRSGLPVAREVNAMDDLKSTDNEVWFVPYK